MEPDVIRYEPHHRERVRPEPLAVVEVVCAVSMQDVGGRPCPEGTHRLEVYERDLPAIMALVADPEVVESDDEGRPTEVRTNPVKIEQAQAALERDRADFLEKKRAEKPAAVRDQLQWYDVAADYTGPVNWIEQYWRTNHGVTHGPALGVPPLRGVKVIARDLPPPLSEEEKRARVQMQGHNEGLLAALRDLVGELKQQPSGNRRSRKGSGDNS